MEMDEKSEREYLRNLMDAGYDEEDARECTLLLKENKISELLRKLSNYRAALLEQVHADERRLDCLDFFTYQIKRRRDI